MTLAVSDCAPFSTRTTIEEQDTIERILEYRGDAEAPPDQRVREVATLPYCPPPGSTAPHRGPPWASSSSSGKRDNQHPQHCGPFCGSPYADLSPWRLQGNLRGSTTGNLWQRKRDGLATSKQILADWVHTSSAQVVIFTSGFVYCRIELEEHSDQRTRWDAYMLIQILKWVLLALKPDLPMPRQGGQTQADTATADMESISWPHLTRELVTTSGSCAAQECCSHVVGRTDCSQGKARTGHGAFSFYAQAGGLIHRQIWGQFLAHLNQKACLGNWESPRVALYLLPRQRNWNTAPSAGKSIF